MSNGAKYIKTIVVCTIISFLSFAAINIFLSFVSLSSLKNALEKNAAASRVKLKVLGDAKLKFAPFPVVSLKDVSISTEINKIDKLEMNIADISLNISFGDIFSWSGISPKQIKISSGKVTYFAHSNIKRLASNEMYDNIRSLLSKNFGNFNLKKLSIADVDLDFEYSSNVNYKKAEKNDNLLKAGKEFYRETLTLQNFAMKEAIFSNKFYITSSVKVGQSDVLDFKVELDNKSFAKAQSIILAIQSNFFQLSYNGKFFEKKKKKFKAKNVNNILNSGALEIEITNLGKILNTYFPSSFLTKKIYNNQSMNLFAKLSIKESGFTLYNVLMNSDGINILPTTKIEYLKKNELLDANLVLGKVDFDKLSYESKNITDNVGDMTRNSLLAKEVVSSVSSAKIAIADLIPNLALQINCKSWVYAKENTSGLLIKMNKSNNGIDNLSVTGILPGGSILKITKSKDSTNDIAKIQGMYKQSLGNFTNMKDKKLQEIIANNPPVTAPESEVADKNGISPLPVDNFPATSSAPDGAIESNKENEHLVMQITGSDISYLLKWILKKSGNDILHSRDSNGKFVINALMRAKRSYFEISNLTVQSEDKVILGGEFTINDDEKEKNKMSVFLTKQDIFSKQKEALEGGLKDMFLSIAPRQERVLERILRLLASNKNYYDLELTCFDCSLLQENFSFIYLDLTEELNKLKVNQLAVDSNNHSGILKLEVSMKSSEPRITANVNFNKVNFLSFLKSNSSNGKVWLGNVKSQKKEIISSFEGIQGDVSVNIKDATIGDGDKNIVKLHNLVLNAEMRNGALEIKNFEGKVDHPIINPVVAVTDPSVPAVSPDVKIGSGEFAIKGNINLKSTPKISLSVSLVSCAIKSISALIPSLAEFEGFVSLKYQFLTNGFYGNDILKNMRGKSDLKIYNFKIPNLGVLEITKQLLSYDKYMNKQEINDALKNFPTIFVESQVSPVVNNGVASFTGLILKTPGIIGNVSGNINLFSRMYSYSGTFSMSAINPDESAPNKIIPIKTAFNSTGMFGKNSSNIKFNTNQIEEYFQKNRIQQLPVSSTAASIPLGNSTNTPVLPAALAPAAISSTPVAVPAK